MGGGGGIGKKEGGGVFDGGGGLDTPMHTMCECTLMLMHANLKTL